MVLLFLGCLGSISITEGTTNESKDAAKEIPLSSNLPTAKLRSLIISIQAFITDDEFIEADFYETLGTIDVSIYDETGNTVYHESVNAYAGQQLLIDITSFEPGVYTIEFVNSQTDLSGEFEI